MFLVKLLVILAMTLVLSTAALARCTTHTVFGPGGAVLICTTCGASTVCL